jgi:hypothetical protein
MHTSPSVVDFTGPGPEMDKLCFVSRMLLDDTGPGSK